jgi:hypothetical protein
MRKSIADSKEATLDAECGQDLVAADHYAELNGSFADFVREHYNRERSALGE